VFAGSRKSVGSSRGGSAASVATFAEAPSRMHMGPSTSSYYPSAAEHNGGRIIKLLTSNNTHIYFLHVLVTENASAVGNRDTRPHTSGRNITDDILDEDIENDLLPE
jgi:hypothetical protein